MRKARFWEIHGAKPFNERQRVVLELLLDGFDDRLTTSAWAGIAGCSPDTALRDIAELVSTNILHKSRAGGRSTSYRLKGSF